MVSNGLGEHSNWIRSSNGTSSSSAIKRNIREAHLCPRWNRSSQLKQNPCSRREANSSGESLFRGTSIGVFIGVGSSDVVTDDKGRGGGLARVGARARLKKRASSSFSSWSLAKPAACTRVRGWCAWTSLRISGVNLEIKQLKKNDRGKPTMWFARSSNSERYVVTVERYVSLERAPVGSSYCNGANRVCNA